MIVPFIIQHIVLKAMQNIEDANFQNMAEVIFAHDFTLIEREEFQELVEFLEENCPWEEFPRNFSEVVTSENENEKEGQ